MEENKATNTADKPKEGAFVDTQPHKYKKQVGKSIATGLAGFIAGAAVSAVVLYPWLYYLGKLCPSAQLTTQSAPQVQQTEQAPAPAPTPTP